jgi:uncharacterized phiE125 gp8 family phage protein
MALTLVTGPVSEPLSTDEFKDFARITDSIEDHLIDSFGLAAREKVEDDTRRALITQTWDWILDEFPDSSDAALTVPLPPLQSITSITYVDTNGTSQTWSADEYQVDSASRQGRIMPAYGESWPDTRDEMNAATVRYIAGYGDNAVDVPERLLQAMKVLVATWYEHREELVLGVKPHEIPEVMAYKRLIWPLRILMV